MQKYGETMQQKIPVQSFQWGWLCEAALVGLDIEFDEGKKHNIRPLEKWMEGEKTSAAEAFNQVWGCLKSEWDHDHPSFPDSKKLLDQLVIEQ